MLVLGIDLETQGFEPGVKITEVGAKLMEAQAISIDRTCFIPVDKMEEYCYEPDYPPQSAHIIEVTGITDKMLQHGGNPRRHVLKEKLFPLMEKADLIMAHYVAFDKRVLDETCAELGLLMPIKPWLCTKADVDWGPQFTSRRLQHLCIDHKMMFDPNLAHRATFDIDLMFGLMSHYSLEKVLEWAKEPWVLYKAQIRPPWEDNGMQRDIAKRLGFGFDTEKKIWVKKTKASKINEIMGMVDKSEAPFNLEILGEVKHG